MTAQGWLQIVLFLGVVLAARATPRRLYGQGFRRQAHLRAGSGTPPRGKAHLQAGGIDPQNEMGWKKYAASVLVFSLVGFSRALPPAAHTGLAARRSLGTGERQSGLGLQHRGQLRDQHQLAGVWRRINHEVSSPRWWVSPCRTSSRRASGIAVVIAFIRGFSRRTTDWLGNFWVDLTRAVLYVLLPLSLVLAIVLVSQGVVQTLDPVTEARLVQPLATAERPDGHLADIAVGPAASQIAIKELGTNGGGFFNANSAHPFENPTPLTDFLELVSIILIPAALCYTFGRMVGNTRQGWVVLAAMMIILRGDDRAAYYFEQQGVPQVAQLGANLDAAGGTTTAQSGGNMEGKEARFGIARLGSLGRRDDRRLQRVREQHARLVHAPRWPRAPGDDPAGGGGLRRSRIRTLRDAGLRHRGRVHRRSHGGPHARVLGQEDRDVRDEDGLPDHPHPGHRHPGGHHDRRGDRRGKVGCRPIRAPTA